MSAQNLLEQWRMMGKKGIRERRWSQKSPRASSQISTRPHFFQRRAPRTPVTWPPAANGMSQKKND
ncbi:hypothetical protein INR49_000704 [Caranx melampygus]|nr:hypothetical protein INR49_000704 [Caranx melampygus]